MPHLIVPSVQPHALAAQSAAPPPVALPRIVTPMPTPAPGLAAALRVAPPPQIAIPHASMPLAPRATPSLPSALDPTPPPPGGYASPSQPFIAHPGSTTTTAATPLPSRVSVLPMVASVMPHGAETPAGGGLRRRSVLVGFALAAALVVGLVFGLGSRRDDSSGRASATSGQAHPLPHASAATLAAASQPTAASPPLLFTANVNDLPRAPGPRRVWVAPRPVPQARQSAPATPVAAAPAATVANTAPAQAAPAASDDQDDDEATPAPTAAATGPAPSPARAAAAPPEPAAPPAPAPTPTDVTPPPPADPLLREIQKAVEDPSRNK